METAIEWRRKLKRNAAAQGYLQARNKNGQRGFTHKQEESFSSNYERHNLPGPHSIPVTPACTLKKCPFNHSSKSVPDPPAADPAT
ncbi:hypothetical protein EYF80_014303 [Liparis tanakae]|uniref:Uncharacterized protein n=1 Tax=Liparis tanakae TaxID=230148 RepID=A0A4Z2ICP3_9TELE|nr:hypothetical protein EYF80_014303 [Liparis tanakae]